mmetsp:Transcript_4077/g.8180  ORF Transcript_4077/g.8180 Transcript_4077/m.8180 type:complete len:120 (+) Transcript_4077:196-555(+)
MSVNTTPVAPKPTPLVILGSVERSRTYRIGDQDHTLGNVLRNILVKGMEDEVDFAGYSVPHPSEAILQMRVQLSNRATLETADDALMDSCDALQQICKHVEGVVEERHKGEEDDAVKIE